MVRDSEGGIQKEVKAKYVLEEGLVYSEEAVGEFVKGAERMKVFLEKIGDRR